MHNSKFLKASLVLQKNCFERLRSLKHLSMHILLHGEKNLDFSTLTCIKLDRKPNKKC